MNAKAELSAVHELRKYAIVPARNSEYETHQPDDDEDVIIYALVNQLGGVHTASNVSDLFEI